MGPIIIDNYRGMEAWRNHFELFRIYKNGEVFAEFYDIVAGKQYLKTLLNESNNNPSTN
jgi:hypothetical protein